MINPYETPKHIEVPQKPAPTNKLPFPYLLVSRWIIAAGLIMYWGYGLLSYFLIVKYDASYRALMEGITLLQFVLGSLLSIATYIFLLLGWRLAIAALIAHSLVYGVGTIWQFPELGLMGIIDYFFWQQLFLLGYCWLLYKNGLLKRTAWVARFWHGLSKIINSGKA